MQNLVTVIIPVYNVEKYIKKCIESVINQSYQSIEIILIDDGSTDGSAKLCKEYANLDSRIRFMHQSNKGVSAARNLGIDSAKGKYICFVDADDYVDEDYIQFMVRGLKEFNVDLSICSPLIEYTEGRWRRQTTGFDKCLDKEEGLISLFSRRGMFGGPICKLYKTDILNHYHIRFHEELKMCEDNVFCYDYIRNCNKIYFSTRTLYYYCLNMNSASNKKYIPESINDSQLHFKAYREIAKTIDNESDKVVGYYLTMMAAKCIRIVYRHNLFNYLSEDEIQYIRLCIMEAYKRGEKSELRIKKGSYILGRIIIINPMLAKWLCKTRKLYKKRI